jgi:hypothetical protein
MIRDMKSLKIFSLAMLLVMTLVGCEKQNNPDGPNGDKGALSGEWVLTSWNEVTPEFNVYIDFNDDNTFEIYQQVWSFDYELFTGTYTITGDIVTGIYTDGSIWASGYKFLKEGDTLTLYSQEDTSVTSVYEKCEIPVAIKEEATSTRSAEVVPFL